MVTTTSDGDTVDTKFSEGNVVRAIFSHLVSFEFTVTRKGLRGSQSPTVPLSMALGIL